MKQDDFVSISDIHIDSNEDPKYQILLNFFKHPKVQTSNHIFLLGDIFDILVGDYSEYLNEYKEFFKTLNEKIESGKRIYWVEGNHDFHFYQIIKKILTKNSLKSFFYCRESIVIIKDTKKYYLSHGDELDFKNPNYLKYRSFMRSNLAQTIINYFISYERAMKLKGKMSRASRKFQANFNEDTSKNKFREYAEFVQSLGFDRVILGHSHIIDNNKGYYNNGYFPNTKKFIWDHAAGTDFVELV